MYHNLPQWLWKIGAVSCLWVLVLVLMLREYSLQELEGPANQQLGPGAEGLTSTAVGETQAPARVA